MEILKKLTWFTLTTIAVSLLMAWSLDSFGVHNPISALLVNWLVLSWIATTTLLAHLSFPPAYYAARPFERTGQLYERLGIRLVKKLLRRGPLRILSPTL